jgi:hypothetical protein
MVFQLYQHTILQLFRHLAHGQNGICIYNYSFWPKNNGEKWYENLRKNGDKVWYKKLSWLKALHVYSNPIEIDNFQSKFMTYS